MSNDKAFKIKNGITVGTTYQQTSGTVSSATNGNDVKSANLEASFYIGTQLTTGQDIFFKNDGTKMYASGDNIVRQYSLSTAWDVSTASYDNKVLNTGGQTSTNLGQFFIGDSGTKLYAFRDSDYQVFQYSLSTAWDVSTGSYSSINFTTTTGAPSGSTAGHTINFSSDGTKMYIHYVTPYEAIYEYDLSTAWNAGTASYSQKSIPITFPDDVISRSYSGLTRGIRFSNDGTEMFMLGKNTHRIYKFALRTAWDISTLSYTGETAPDYLFRELHNERSPVENNTSGLALNTEDGATFYMRGQQRYTVLQFTGSGTTKTLDLSSGNYFKINTSAGVDIEFSNPPPSGVAYAATIEIESGGEYNIQSAYMSGYIETQEYDGETAANGVTFKPDGTKMYVVGQGQDVAHQYSLSVAWDITSATLETEVSLAASGTVPEAIQFKPDGSIMYILDSNTDSVYQYTLRIPWNVSSSYGTPTSFSVANEETVPCGMWFKTDGTKMFVTGTNGDDLNEYALSTAWDVTSATLTQAVAYPEWGSNIFAGQNPEGVAFSSDGTRVFVLCQNTFIVSFPLSTAWDISTMGNHDRFFDINCNVGIGLGEVMNSCRDIFMSPNGDKFFIVGQRQQNFDGAGQTDGVGAFSLGPTYKVKWPSSIKWEQNAAANPPDVNSKCIYTILTIDGGSTYYGKVSGGHVV